VSHTLRIGARIGSADPFWVQVRESVDQQAQNLSLELAPIDLGHSSRLPDDEDMDLVEELLAQGLDALISTYLPDRLALRILDFGLPIIHLTESAIRHPLFVSPIGFYDIARTIGDYLITRLGGSGRILAIGGLLADRGEDGKSRLAGIRDAFRAYPCMRLHHLPSAWRYEQAYDQIVMGLRGFDQPFDAIFGFSDSLALAARDAVRALGSLHPLIVGINGDPEALVAISEGSLAATVETSAADFGRQALDLACQAARGQQLPVHFSYQPRLVTAENVSAVAMQKLTEIAGLPNRLVGVNHRQDQRRLTQLNASLEISRCVGSILDRRQLSREIAEVIRASYGYDHVQLFRWLEQEQVLALEAPIAAPDNVVYISPNDPGPLGEALRRNAAIFIADTRRSHRFAPDPVSPDTRSRVALPIRLGERLLGLLDLHSRQTTQHTRQELVGLQSLADQLGVAMRNAELYSEALDAKIAAEKADQLKSRLLANVSHELRTPLNVILGYSEAALTTPNQYAQTLPPALLYDLRQIHQSGVHLTRIINDLLDLSRAEIDELDLYPEMIEPRSFLEDVFRSVSESGAAQRGVHWRLELPDYLPFIEADPVRLRQILLNLLSNACKFTADGYITLGAEVALPHLHIRIADSGSGIPIDQQERIFEPFVTLGSTDRRPDGIGLGLCITRRLVALHHGSMSLESQPGQGSTFHVYLPLPSLSTRPAEAAASAEPLLLLISASEPPPAIAQLSRRQGLSIRRLQAGDDLPSLLTMIRPTAIAWDLAHTTRNDWAIVQQIRERPQWLQLPFILFNHTQESEQPEGLTNFLVKPLSGATITEIINAVRPPDVHGTVLIVDDDAQARDFYRRLVTAELPSYAVKTAGGGAEALAILSEEIPSLIVLDLQMPDVDGFVVLERLRASRRTRHVPVLVMSGRTLSVHDIDRLNHARVIVQTKDMLSKDETAGVIHRSLSGEGALAQQTSTLVKRAIAHMQRHFACNLSRGDIAGVVGVSQNYLSQIFQREVGISPWEYLNRYRIKRARELLHTSDASITAIAAQVGFDDPAYFSRVFRKQVGCSPVSYREELGVREV
jgi:signal transduction histidine kinase/AraC-like DNA-binding protein/ABC-type sugar transport system substrate-binding protein